MALVDAGDAIRRGEAPVLPPHLALTFGPAANTKVATEAIAGGWVVAADDAFPSIRVFANGKWRQGDAREMAILEALALALPLYLDAPRAGRADDTVGWMIEVMAQRRRTVVKLLAVTDHDRNSGSRRRRVVRRSDGARPRRRRDAGTVDVVRGCRPSTRALNAATSASPHGVARVAGPHWKPTHHV